MSNIDQIRAEFPILGRKIYLNSCSLGALSLRSEARLHEFTELWHDLGASAWYGHWLNTVEELRGRVATFWGATARETALLPSTSAALSVVSSCVTAGERNRVVCTELDFPTLVYQWSVKPEIDVVVLPSDDGVTVDPERFEEAVDERTLFLATSHVFFKTGHEQDIARLASIARAAGALSVIDGYQGAGQIELDLASTGVDFYTSGPLKWLCGGPGLAYLYVRGELIESLEPRITSWFATRGQFDFDPFGFEYHPDARRFELGTPPLPTVHTALGGQEIVDEVGMAHVVARNESLTDRLVERARESGLQVVRSESMRPTAIVLIRHDDPPAAVGHLANEGVIVDHRPGVVRVSPHFYNTEEEIDRCIELLADYSA